jgi:hypothetical protein
MAATSAEFDLIQQAIESMTTQKAIQATWITDGNQCVLWPLVVGFNDDGAEKVLCYKFDSANTNARNFRCYFISQLTGVARADWPITPSPPPIQEPKGLRFRQVVRQNCVKDVEAYRRFK